MSLLLHLLKRQLAFDYRIRFSHRKTAAIHIGKEGVEVRAPYATSELWIHQLVQSKAEWVQRKLSELEDRKKTLFRVANGGEVWFLGEPLALIYRYGEKSGLTSEPGRLVIHIAAYHPLDGLRSPDEVAKSLFEHWLRQQAREYMTDRAYNMARRLGLSHRLKEVRFRKTKSKWGHCSSKGVIQFNWQIMMAPEPVVNYLVAHEVCHLQFMNHSSDFWHLVGSVCPGYEKQEAWLKANEYRLQWY